MMKFSVLISVYHKENPEYLIKSLESIINQTLIPEEIVLIKDGVLGKELDNVIAIFEKKYPNIFTVIALSQNKGLANALNIGISKARNPIIARMDSDDICFENRFEVQLNYMLKNDLDIVGGQIVEFSKDIVDVVSIREVPILHDDLVKFMKFRSPFSHPTVIFKKSILESLQGYDVTIFPEDYDLFVRAYLNGCKFGNVKEKVLYFRLGENLSDAIKRRWGLKYALNEIKLYKKFLKQGFFNYFDFIKVLLMKVPLRIIPFKLYSFIYFKFAR